MQQVQFFLFGLLLVWLIGTGKLASFFAALASTPKSTTPPTGPPAPSNPLQPAAPDFVHPCSDDPTQTCIYDSSGHELHVMI